MNTKNSRVVIVGRPNVGKSTLFNRLTGSRRAIVHDRPGVTRDRIIHETEWVVAGQRYPIELIDTGGLGDGTFQGEISAQVDLALSEAQAMIWVVDGREGATPLDLEVAERLRRSGALKNIPTVVAVNKIDVENLEAETAHFYSLGADKVVAISAEHNRGTEVLKEEVVALGKLMASTSEPTTSQSELPRIAIVGRPNVGKSTLLNAILGEERSITSPIAGTTSDAVDAEVELDGLKCVLIDTAGIRRKSRTEKGIEVLSVVQTKKTLERADLAILILDGEVGITDQDEKIGGLIEEAGCSVIIALNKWDTQDETGFTKKEAAERVRKAAGFLGYAPIVFMSAIRNEGTRSLGPLIREILEQKETKLATSEFTNWLRSESEIHNPQEAKFYLCHQSGRHPPTFVCHVNDPNRIHFSLKRHLINAMRARWGFMGTPVRLHFVRSKSAGDRASTR